MNRCQFPINLAYCMTIHKAQGQTFSKVGVNLDTPCFAHGQLYVALSRCCQSSDLRVFIKDGINQGKTLEGHYVTPNIVYK